MEYLLKAASRCAPVQGPARFLFSATIFVFKICERRTFSDVSRSRTSKVTGSFVPLATSPSSVSDRALKLTEEPAIKGSEVSRPTESVGAGPLERISAAKLPLRVRPSVLLYEKQEPSRARRAKPSLAPPAVQPSRVPVSKLPLRMEGA